MKTFSSILVLTAMVIAFTNLSGCSKSVRSGEELHLILEHDLRTLDPALSTATNSGKLVALIFNTLVIYDKEGKISPELAKDWSISSDGKTYSFTIRDDGFFSTGRNVKADDFTYSIERVMAKDSKSPRKWVFEKLEGAKAYSEGNAKTITGIKTSGDYTLSLTLTSPFAPFLGFLAMPAAAVVDRESAEKAGESFGRNPVGSGPYKLEKWTMGSEIVLSRNEQSKHKTNLKKIVYKIINEPFTYSTEFKVGNLDMIPLPYSEVGSFQNTKYGANLF